MSDAPPPLRGHHTRLEFDSVRTLSEWYRAAVLTGTISLEPGGPALPVGTPVEIDIVVAAEGIFGARATVIEGSSKDGSALCTLWARADLQALLAKFRLAERSATLSQSSEQRRSARFDASLNAVFRSYQQLVGEYVSNISTGGMFVRTERPLAVGHEVVVDVTFPNGQTHAAHARIVRRVSAETAATSGQVPGVGLELLDPSAFTEAVEHLVSRFLSRARRILLADDDRLILQAVSDSLMLRGVEVVVASSGSHASKKLVDLFYELDAVVLDLKMPGVDGAVLLQRLRRMRREMDLRLVVLSAEPPEVLQQLVGPDGADAAISKRHPMETIVDLVHAAVSK